MTTLTLLFPLLLFPAHGIGDIRLLDLHFCYGPEQVHEYLLALGAKGRDAYTSMLLTSDLIFPIVYSLALSVALTLLLRGLLAPAKRFRYLNLLPFMVVFFDWLENFSIARITHVFPERADQIVGFSSLFTSLKWSVIAVTTLLLLTLFFAVVFERIRRI